MQYSSVRNTVAIGALLVDASYKPGRRRLSGNTWRKVLRLHGRAGHLVRVRDVVESATAEFAATRRTAEHLHNMRGALEAMAGTP
jgi:DNA-binding FadR family transcriptional regulator